MYLPRNRDLTTLKHAALTGAAFLATLFFAAPALHTQSLQRGVNVQLAATTSAAPMPDADSEDAFVVTVSAEGSIFLEAEPITLNALAEKVKTTPFWRGQKIYIKADGRVSYATMLQVLDATRTGGIAPQVLLTAQNGPATPGTSLPPEGIEVQLGPHQSSR
jgi:biopolymer transport protein ExbD